MKRDYLYITVIAIIIAVLFYNAMGEMIVQFSQTTADLIRQR